MSPQRASEHTTDPQFNPRPILTIDVVKFSKQHRARQMHIVETLIWMLNKAIPEQVNNEESRVWSPAGDGGAITFLTDIYAAVDTALNLAELLNQHNESNPDERFEMRMGLHVGPVAKGKDFDGRENIWGTGMNMSARIANLTQPNQILASEAFYEQVDQFANYPKLEVTCVGEWWVKHGMSIVVYNLQIPGKNIGIPSLAAGEWYEPFQDPLRYSINTYEAMLERQIATSEFPFRIAVLAKRILDLQPDHKGAQEKLWSISRKYWKSIGGKRPFVHFFSELSPSSLEYFFRNAKFVNYAAGETIIREGEEADSLMVIVSGRTKTTVPRENYLPLPPTEPEEKDYEGMVFGEMALFEPEFRRIATIEALIPTVVLKLDYRFLKPELNTSDRVRRIITDIRGSIWKELYSRRVIENYIHTDSLLRHLSDDTLREVIQNAQFVPQDLDTISRVLPREEVWNSWIIVVRGYVEITTPDGDCIRYGPQDALNTLGALRLHTDASVCPYDQVKLPDPQACLIWIPFEIIEQYVHAEAQFYSVSKECAQREIDRYGL